MADFRGASRAGRLLRSGTVGRRRGRLSIAWRDDSGAVSVDWVVLSAAIIGTALGAISQISDATSSLASKTQTGIADSPVGDD